MSFGLPAPLLASLPLSWSFGAAVTIVAKAIAAMKEMMDFWNNIVKECGAKLVVVSSVCV